MAQKGDIDLGYRAAEASRNQFPPGVRPNRSALSDGSVVNWHIGSLYNADGSFRSRQILLQFERTAEGKNDPNTLYRIGLHKDADGSQSANLSASQEKGDWRAVDGVSTTWIPPGTRKHPTFPGPYPEVEPSALMNVVGELANTREFGSAVDAHVGRAKAAVSPPTEQHRAPLRAPSP